jgi:hypothetical protein
MTVQGKSSFLQRPATRLGWWAFGLLAAFVVLFLINSFVFMRMPALEPQPWWRQALLPFYGIFMLLCGLASGVFGLIALFRSGDRSWLVWLTITPGVWVIFMLVGELLFAH